MHSGAAQNQPNMLQRAISPIQTPVGDNLVKSPVAINNDMPHTVFWWLGLFLVFVGWGWLQHKDKVKTELEPKNVQANLHNLAVITFAAVIGLVGGKILFTKLAGITQNIPILGRITGYIAQLFSAS